MTASLNYINVTVSQLLHVFYTVHHSIKKMTRWQENTVKYVYMNHNGLYQCLLGTQFGWQQSIQHVWLKCRRAFAIVGLPAFNSIPDPVLNPNITEVVFMHS